MGPLLAVALAVLGQTQEAQPIMPDGFRWLVEIQNLSTKETRTFRSSAPFSLPKLWDVSCRIEPSSVTLLGGKWRSQMVSITCAQNIGNDLMVWTAVSQSCIDEGIDGGTGFAAMFSGQGSLLFQRVVAADASAVGVSITTKCIR